MIINGPLIFIALQDFACKAHYWGNRDQSNSHFKVLCHADRFCFHMYLFAEITSLFIYFFTIYTNSVSDPN